MMLNSKDEPSTEEQRKCKILDMWFDLNVTPTDVVTENDGEMGCFYFNSFYLLQKIQYRLSEGD